MNFLPYEFSNRTKRFVIHFIYRKETKLGLFVRELFHRFNFFRDVANRFESLYHPLEDLHILSSTHDC